MTEVMAKSGKSGVLDVNSDSSTFHNQHICLVLIYLFYQPLSWDDFTLGVLPLDNSAMCLEVHREYSITDQRDLSPDQAFNMGFESYT